MELNKITLPFRVKHAVLALGAHTKNTLCFLKGNSGYLGPVHADLSNPKDFLEFRREVKYFLKKHPGIIAHDLHPEYQSSKHVYQLRIPDCELRTIQHHHSHIASCMADCGLKNQKVIGVAFDGTGLGTDNKLWGAEFLICDYKSFKRSAHLKEVPLIGSDTAILEPYRIALIWLYWIYKEKLFSLKLDFIKGIDRKKWRVLKDMCASNFNSPLASSMGRLFDAAASLILAKYKVNFEAELAMELETIASGFGNQAAGYNFRIVKHKNEYILDPAIMFKQIAQDLEKKVPKEKIAYRFHAAVAGMVKKMCMILRNDTKINKVVLSGGCFKNKLLLSLCLDALHKEKFKAYTHRQLPCSDAGLSLGEAIIAGIRG